MQNARIDPSSLPREVRDVAASLRRRGGRAWLVGGTVRDLMLGLPPHDFDIATDLEPAAVCSALPAADARDGRLGTCRLHSAVGEITITTLRAEGGYEDHRRPQQVRFLDDPAEDALRRDFTVNALYYDLADGSLFDSVGGRADLEKRCLRTIGAPDRRFREDALRLLRLWRFAATCELDIDPGTAAAAVAAAPDLRLLARERVFEELTRTFTSRGRGRCLDSLVELGFAAVVLPEVAAMQGVTQPPEYHPEGDVLTHVGLVLENVPEGDPLLAWSAVLHDVGKPPTWRMAEDRIRFDGHDTLSATMAAAVLERLGAPRELREGVAEICRDHIRFAALPGMRPRRREAWLRTPRFPQHLQFHRADCLGSHGDLRIHDFAAAELAALPPLAPPLVTGKDVLELGVPPGPAVGEFLARVHAVADEAPVAMDRAAALILLREIVAAERQDRPSGSR